MLIVVRDGTDGTGAPYTGTGGPVTRDSRQHDTAGMPATDKAHHKTSPPRRRRRLDQRIDPAHFKARGRIYVLSLNIFVIVLGANVLDVSWIFLPVGVWGVPFVDCFVKFWFLVARIGLCQPESL